MHVWSKLSSTKWQDAWEERFLAQGQTNCVISELPGGKRIRIEVYCETGADARAIAEQFGGSVRRLKKENWAALAPPQHAPIQIRDALVISAEADPTKLAKLRAAHPSRRVISIPPELAFGTGDHATTSTCLRLLVDIARGHEGTGADWSMMDMGCGTGLLAIAAHHLGAARVEGFDFDPTAVRVALRNLGRNEAGSVRIGEADVFEWRPPRAAFDVICANLFANILSAHAGKIATALKPGGQFILSGILREHEASVLAAVREAGLPEPEAHRRGKWVTLRGGNATANIER